MKLKSFPYSSHIRYCLNQKDITDSAFPTLCYLPECPINIVLRGLAYPQGNIVNEAGVCTFIWKNSFWWTIPTGRLLLFYNSTKRLFIRKRHMCLQTVPDKKNLRQRYTESWNSIRMRKIPDSNMTETLWHSYFMTKLSVCSWHHYVIFIFITVIITYAPLSIMSNK